jgi:TPR repeat protein
MARLLADGNGVPKDPAKALGMMDAGCKAGDAGSCDLLGFWHATGKVGLSPNGPKGIEYLQMACDDSSWGSCVSIGQIYADGIGGAPKNRDAAAQHFKLACDHGYDDGCRKLKALGT